MTYDIYGIGNALVDAEYAVDETFLRDQGIAKGHMTLVSQEEIEVIATGLEGRQSRRMSGGSAANTVYAVQGFGGRGFYSGRVGDDETGRHFLDDLRVAGIDTGGRPTSNGRSGRCLTLVTADAERSMTTYLGVSASLSSDDVNEAALAASRYLYVEGYLASTEPGCAAAVFAREVAESAGVKTSLSLSDPSMVQGFRAALEVMLGNGVTQLFCNEEEALAWTGTDRLDIAATELGDVAPFVNITLGARGSLALSPRGRELTPGRGADAVDTTGAGDIYAGAILYARNAGAAPREAAGFANFAAAHLVSVHGARLPDLPAYAAVKKAFAGP
ncbi:MAG: adenosine kinase [Gammaproteobacteria bacterium]|nr:adenosine kinase [Gammaproteobacteria bacterium]